MVFNELEIAKEAIEALREWPVIQIDVHPTAAVALIAHLQLALRHPGNTGETTTIVREFISKLTSRLPVELWPIIQCGFDPRYDVAKEHR